MVERMSVRFFLSGCSRPVVHGKKGPSLTQLRRHFEVFSGPVTQAISQRNGSSPADEVDVIFQTEEA